MNIQLIRLLGIRFEILVKMQLLYVWTGTGQETFGSV